MKTIHIFNVDDYHHSLSPTYQHPNYYQRGSGLGSAFGTVKRYSIPLVKKYVIPHVKSAVVNTARDVIHGTSIRSALKNNAVDLFSNVGKDVLSTLVQTGR